MEKKASKIVALIITIPILIISIINLDDLTQFAIYANCPTHNRLIYHLFHANIFHALLNLWSFLAVVFITEISIYRIIAAFIFATIIPIDFFATHIPSFGYPTVGLSAIIFFLFASLSFDVVNKRNFNIGMIVALGVGFIMPQSNGWIHLYCYIGGILYSLINHFKKTWIKLLNQY